jgi:hypothetical protein
VTLWFLLYVAVWIENLILPMKQPPGRLLKKPNYHGDLNFSGLPGH